MTRTLQEGIYYDCSGCTGQFFAILFLRGAPGAAAPGIGAVLAELWPLYQGLKRGEVPDLPGHPVPPGSLQALIGYGRDLFTRPGIGQPAPPDLRRFSFDRRTPPAGAAVTDNAGLRYAGDLADNPAEADVAVQLTADTQLAVYRGVVETWKRLHDLGGTEEAPLRLSGFFSGFQRDDRRSWIDFHDGVNNLRRGQEREQVITVKASPAARWTEGGTYLAYLRIAVDLAAWRALTPQQQEIAVGRAKLTGAPLVALSEDGRGLARSGCPVSGTIDVLAPGSEACREPPDVPAAHAPLRRSHVQRANHHVPNPADPSSLRIFRQGYEFLEPAAEPPFFRAGLNFVSFQDTPQRVQRLLAQNGWLGQVNFAGDPQQPVPGTHRLLTVHAAGVFVVPPVTADEPFPGAGLVGQASPSVRAQRGGDRG